MEIVQNLVYTGVKKTNWPYRYMFTPQILDNLKLKSILISYGHHYLYFTATQVSSSHNFMIISQTH